MSQLIEPLEPTAPSRIGQLAIPVADLDRAVRFYGETLGCRDSEQNLLALMSEVRPPAS